ncbi:MAG: hypothetical protein KDD99_20145 [Bacteroidetes bacterium]|nr:hypothetical protein [Bacteroidota bacterium]
MLEKIKDLLSNNGIAYKTLHHEPTLTSEDSAKVRGESLAIGGKALVIKVDKQFHLFVISAACKMDSKAIKAYFGAKKSRFASPDELMEMTGLVPGSVPPFGRPIIDLDLYVDESVLENERIAFNAGSLTDSVIMKTSDYLALAKPVVIKFSV